jgi:hypothetical protein
MKAIKISVVQNGYIVTESPVGEYSAGGTQLLGYTCAPYVFESFAAMTAWLGVNLEEPAQAKKEGGE